MKHGFLASMSLAAALLAAGCAATKPAPYRDSGTTCMKDALAKWIDSGELPGAVSVLYNNGVQETACLGYADAEAKRPITLDCAYMQCSQSKGFCGVTVAKLVEEGKISLDDPVSKYLPEFKNLKVYDTVKTADGKTHRIVRPVKNVLTVRMVMNHTGGFDFELPNYEAQGGWSRRAPLRSVAAIAAGIPLQFEPGTNVKYSNVGIDIGAAVVEVASGMRWEDYIKKNVFDPLGMKDTGFWPSDEAIAGRVVLYKTQRGAKAKRLDQARSMQRPWNDDRVFPSAGAGVWTTPGDQLKFYKMLMNLGVGENGVRILKEETVKNILAKSTRPRELARRAGGYSLGLGAPVDDSEDGWFGHGGAYSTNCMVNWHRRQLKLWGVQIAGQQEWNKARDAAADRFFKTKIDNTDAEAYTGRMK